MVQLVEAARGSPSIIRREGAFLLKLLLQARVTFRMLAVEISGFILVELVVHGIDVV